MSWSSFSGDQVAALAQGESLFAQPGERECPACGRRGVRAYVNAPANARRPTLMFNGYAEQVAGLYKDMDLSVNY